MLLIPKLYSDEDKNNVIYKYFYKKEIILNNYTNFKSLESLKYLNKLSKIGYIVNIKYINSICTISIILNKKLVYTYNSSNQEDALFEILFLFTFDQIIKNNYYESNDIIREC
jgi:hypothetical protein